MVSFFIEATQTPQRRPALPPPPAGQGPAPPPGSYSGVLLLLFGDQMLDKRNLGFFLWSLPLRCRSGGQMPRPRSPTSWPVPHTLPPSLRPPRGVHHACLESITQTGYPSWTTWSPGASWIPRATGNSVPYSEPACPRTAPATPWVPAPTPTLSPPAPTPRRHWHVTQLLDHVVQHLVLLLLPGTEQGCEGRTPSPGPPGTRVTCPLTCPQATPWHRPPPPWAGPCPLSSDWGQEGLGGPGPRPPQADRVTCLSLDMGH